MISISDEWRSPNFNKRKGNIAPVLLLHYTGMKDRQAALERLTDKVSQVSAHYVVDEDGKIFNLVPEDKRAWHAGVSFWRGIRDINSCSIGIEMVNRGEGDYPPAQLAATLALAQDIQTRHDIKYVLGHSDVAPERKLDPGEHFNWKALADKGVGIWVEAPAPDENFTDPQSALPKLLALGYDPASPTDILLKAFQRHWRQARVDGLLDSSTARTLDAVLKKI